VLPSSLAQFQYWQAERGAWPRLLDRIVDLGFPAVATDVPWSIHIPQPGAADWGQQDARLDLAAFLRLCQARGLAVHLCPGPGAGVALRESGYPRWVIADPAVPARDAAGHKVALFGGVGSDFPAPSYASEAFYRHLAGWLDEAARRIVPFLQPNGGPVVALQVAGDLSSFADCGPFAWDYHLGAIQLYREWLSDPNAEPPRAFDAGNIPRILRWCEFREWLLIHALDRLSKMFRERGLTGIPLTHNLPAQTPPGVAVPGAGPLNLWAMERTSDVVGLALPATLTAYQDTRQWARYVHAASRFPTALALGLGHAGNGTPPDHDVAAFYWRALLMHGVRAVTHTMLVEREQGIESPLGPAGELRPAAGRYVLLNDVQRRLAGSRKQVQVLILSVRDYTRLAAASRRAEPRPDPGDNLDLPERWVSADRFGFRRPIPRDDLAWYRAVEAALQSGGYAADIGDDSLPMEILRRYKVVICPAFDFMPRITQQKLLGYVQRGGHLAYGPDLPYLDEHLQPYRLLADLLVPFATEPDDPRFAANLHTEMEIAGIRPVVEQADPLLDFAVHRLPDGRRVLFAANPSPEERECEIAGLGAPFDPTSPAPSPTGQVRLPPYSIGIWEFLAH
jgi:beta-galactosidase